MTAHTSGKRLLADGPVAGKHWLGTLTDVRELLVVP